MELASPKAFFREFSENMTYYLISEMNLFLFRVIKKIASTDIFIVSSLFVCGFSGFYLYSSIIVLR